MEYCYWCTQRPPAPGAIPKGAIDIEYTERYMEDLGGHMVYVWGIVWYDRELTDKEINDYELTIGE